MEGVSNAFGDLLFFPKDHCSVSARSLLVGDLD